MYTKLLSMVSGPTDAKEKGEEFPPIRNLNDFLLRSKVEFEERWNSIYIPRAELSDFERFRTVGEGAFGRVMLVRHKPTNNYCAMKILEKASIVATKQVEHVYYEMKTLLSVRFPFIVYMKFAIKDNSYLYFIQPFIAGGEMYVHLRQHGRFDEVHSKFYAAQVCLGLEYLQNLNVLYRDLKPENILIDPRGYLKLTDLGFCKVVRTRTYTFCGTPEYMAPEIILGKSYAKAVDWWSYGILLFEMNAGYAPFSSVDPMKIYNKVVAGKYKLPFHFSNELKDLITHLLEPDATKRYGNLVNGVNDIKLHQWLKSTNWLNLLNYKVTAPYVPRYTNITDAKFFEVVPEKPLKIARKDKYAKVFENF